MTKQPLFALDDVRKPMAIFSDCGNYRWFLQWPTRVNNDRKMLMVGANPSIAGSWDEQKKRIRSDPTVSRMTSLASELGHGWLTVVNARSWIATDPDAVPGDDLAIGHATDDWILQCAHDADLVVVCYGHLAGTRAPRVLELVRQAGRIPHALALTSDGTPRHPRGVPSDARPFPLP